MKKEIIKPFSLEAWKNGAKVKTRTGHEARIICTDAKRPSYPVIALVNVDDNRECIMSYTPEGKEYYSSADSNPNDLVIVEEVEEPEFWSDKENEVIEGHYISLDSTISPFCTNINANNYGLFATEKQAKSALAMARISQIMANDIEHFGGVVTDKEWKNDNLKHAIYRFSNNIYIASTNHEYFFLAFHTVEQRNLFLDKYRDLVEDYLMIG